MTDNPRDLALALPVLAWGTGRRDDYSVITAESISSWAACRG